jgi:NADPH-dependent 2,4-dienoyl-CoA reductase/sulfur reductase-like enzyme
MIRENSRTGIFPEPIRRLPREREDIVIVGNGIAGLTAAIEARRRAPEKHVTIITEQSHPTIYTPALKQFASGKLTREHLLAFPAGIENLHGIQVLTARVEEIQAQEQYIHLNTGHDVGYKSLLLATGSTPTGLPPSLPGHNFDGVLTLHRLNDYLDLRRRFPEVKDAVVIGGGTHAVETVMSLLQRHIRVHWLIRGETFLSRILDRDASAMVIAACRRAGGTVLTSTEVVGIVGKVGAVAGVVTNDGQMLPCQLVIACTGSRPAATLAERCDIPLEQQRGILVDDYLHTSVENIFAAGDCATLMNPQTGSYQPCMQWFAAVSQGQIAAGAMTGHTDSMPVPGALWHATKVGTLAMVSVGDPLSTATGITILTDKQKKSYRRLAFYDNRLIGYLALGNSQIDSFAIKRLIDEGHSIRGIEKDLLFGNFDGARYFSQARTQAISPPVHTENLPAIQPLYKTERARDTEPLLPVLVAEETHDTQNDEARPQKEHLEMNHGLFETVRKCDTREVYTHAREIAQCEQSERTMLLEEIEHSFGDSFPLQKFRHLLERERDYFEQSPQHTTATRSFTSLISRQSAPTRWIVQSMIPEGVCFLTDTQKSGTAWFNLALGLRTSGNCSWATSSKKTRQGNVLYLALEDDEHQLHGRMEKLLAPDVPLSDTFDYATTWSRMNNGGLTALEDWLLTHSHAQLIIIDSWKKVKPIVRAKTGDTARSAEYKTLAGLKYLADKYNIGIVLLTQSARTAPGKHWTEPYGVAGAASCVDGFLTLKQGKKERDTLFCGSWGAYRSDADVVESIPDSWSAYTEIEEERLIKQQPVLSLVR